jgi:RES domain
MARAKPGPRGDAPAPPAWLATATLPIDTFPTGAVWFRCHRTLVPPVFFGPGPAAAPKHRFDAPAAEFQVLYLGLSYDAAIVETLFRNPRRRTVDRSDIDARSIATLTNAAPLRLVQGHGSGLARLGTTASLSTGGYRASRRWALEIWRHKDQPDGLVYVSRHNPKLLCAAVFDRYQAGFTQSSAPLLDDAAALATVFLGHGKSIA